MNKKIAVIWVSLAMVLSFIVIIIEIAQVVEAPTIIYVDDVPGIGPGNPPEDFTSIQDAINAGNDGDTVFVYNGTYDEDVWVNKMINLTGENRDSTIIDFKGGQHIIYVDANWVNITNLTLNRNSTTGSGAGICIYNCQNCSIYNISVNNSMFGIKVNRGNNSNINCINLTNNDYGIWVVDSVDSIISDCLSFNNYYAIHLGISTNITLINNSMNNDGIGISGTMFEDWVYHNIDTTNTVNGKPVYYWKNQKTKTVPNDAGQVILANCTNIVIENQNVSDTSAGILVGFSSTIYIANNTARSNTDLGIEIYKSDGNIIDNDSCISNGGTGIEIAYSHNNSITNNTVDSNAWYGIRLWQSDNNVIINNNISFNNQCGMRIQQMAKDNYIYHNNFINNAEQANADGSSNFWYDTYPSGGNFWSDYDGIDLNSTPAQDVPPPDGIGDTPYFIDPDSQDDYPLMSPIGNCIFLRESWNLISLPFIQPDTNFDAVLSPIRGSYDAVQWYNAGDNSDYWKHNSIKKPPNLNDLYSIDHTMGFWIHITKPGGVLFEYLGTQPTVNQTITLHPGWNLVGYPSLTNYNRTEGLNNLTFGTHIDAILTYNVATQKWKEIGASDYFEIGRGYWVHAKVKCEWEVPL